MKIIVPVVTAVVLALALMPASAASRHHKRHSEAATVGQPQIACTVVGCIPAPGSPMSLANLVVERGVVPCLKPKKLLGDMFGSRA
jgi:hypothetical protein